MDPEYVDLKNCSLAYSFNTENIFERYDFCVDFSFFFNLKYFTKDFVSVQYPTESLAPKKQAISHRGTISLKINTVLSLTLVIKADG